MRQECIAHQLRRERERERERESWGQIMNCTAMLECLLLLCYLAITVSAQTPSTEGFISIDCGLPGNVSYKENGTGILFSPDEPYTTAGLNKLTSAITIRNQIKQYYRTVRSFPEGIRNCYTLKPLNIGAKYRIEAQFLYGNYDGLNQSPTFDLYLDVNLWTTAIDGRFAREEIIAMAMSDSMDVCLVNTNRGTPFISALMLRPILLYMYPEVTTNQSLVVSGDRLNYGGQNQIAFPDDAFDRLWVNTTTGIVINTSLDVRPPVNNGVDFPMPTKVLQTAVTASSRSESLKFTVGSTSTQRTYVYNYFAELEQLASNEIREFNIYAGEGQFYTNYIPIYLQSEVILTKPPGASGGMTYYLSATPRSTLPPMITALEPFIVQEVTLRPTDQSEVNAMLELKRSYGLIKNWQGDPCLPESFIWEGIECDRNPSIHPSITLLDLSGSGLRGPIPPSIENLTRLTSLDLSKNNLTGEIPSYLGDLPALRFLNLEENNLSGFIPESVNKSIQDGSLKLRINGNPILCSNVGNLCKPTKKGNIIIIAIVVPLGIALAIGITVTFYFLRKRGANNPQNGPLAQEMIDVNQEVDFPTRYREFSSPEIENITRNFCRTLGRGGFGTVYYGILEDRTEVAVKKLNRASPQGEIQFITEAKLLTRAHHKHVVTLLGYCTASLALVYEYVPMGSLQKNLSESIIERNLDWGTRLQIALQAAQGLEYLHNGCNPPIIHRDVKPANILLNARFEVKLADFGLSKFFEEDNTNTPSACGTHGYMDPEIGMKRLDQKSDVYSFGVVLLELVTGKPAIGHNSEPTPLPDFVRSVFERNHARDVVDERINGQYDIESATHFIRLALECTFQESSGRPTMDKVVADLTKIKETAGNYFSAVETSV